MATNFQVNAIPSFNGLRIYLFCASLFAASAFIIPIQLAQTFSGKISSNGPTTEIQSSGDANVSRIPRENLLAEKNVVLFSFSEPRFTGDLDLLEVKKKGLDDEFNEVREQCRQRLSGLGSRVANARLSYDMYRDAFEKQAVSQVVLVEHQDRLDEAAFQLKSEQASCKEKLLVNRNQHKLALQEISRQISQTQFDRELRAPDRGVVHSILVKVGQRVSKGQTLAQFTALGSSGAVLRIPLEDRPFLSIGSQYRIYSKAYAFMVKQPERQCTITSITPDAVNDGNQASGPHPSYAATCQFRKPPMSGSYPLLVGMEVEAQGAHVHASLIQLLLQGYRELTTKQTDRLIMQQPEKG